MPALDSLGDRDPGAARNLANSLPSGSYVALVTPQGGVVGVRYVGTGNHRTPDFLASAPTGISTIDDYRVQAVDAASVAPPDSIASGSATLVIAVPLDDVHSTVQRLTMIELLVGAIALVAVGVLALIAGAASACARWAGSSRRPGAIAAGDLSQRVENSDPRTEVGRLGRCAQRDAGADRARVRRAASGRRTGCAGSSPTPRTSCGRR